ncbi:hypothetical protein BH10ACT6_BH10ACT6_15940 [soil metagenome]
MRPDVMIALAAPAMFALSWCAALLLIPPDGQRHDVEASRERRPPGRDRPSSNAQGREWPMDRTHAVNGTRG